MYFMACFALCILMTNVNKPNNFSYVVNKWLLFWIILHFVDYLKYLKFEVADLSLLTSELSVV